MHRIVLRKLEKQDLWVIKNNDLWNVFRYMINKRKRRRPGWYNERNQDGEYLSKPPAGADLEDVIAAELEHFIPPDVQEMMFKKVGYDNSVFFSH